LQHTIIKASILLSLAALQTACVEDIGVDENPDEGNQVTEPTVAGALPGVTPPESFSDETIVTVVADTQQYIGDVSALDRTKFINMNDWFGDWDETPARIGIMKDRYDLGQGRGPDVSTFRRDGVIQDVATIQDNGLTNQGYDAENANAGLFDNKWIATQDANVVFGANRDPVAGSVHAANYFMHYFNDEGRPQYYELMRTPFALAADFESDFALDSAGIRGLMTTWYAEVGKEFNSRPELDGVSVLGYAATDVNMERNDFAHWNEQMKLFIDEAGPHVDALSVHLYDDQTSTGEETERSGSNVQAILDLMETYSMQALGEVKPLAVPEYGLTLANGPSKFYNPVANSQPIKSFNHIMLELMERENRVLTSVPNVTGRDQDYWQDPELGNGNPSPYSLWQPNRDSVIFNGYNWQFEDYRYRDEYLTNRVGLFYEFWGGVKGKRARVYVNDPDIQATAFIEEDKAHIIIANLEADYKTLQLDIAEMLGYNFSSVQTERLLVSPTRAATLDIVSEDLTTAVDGTSQAFGNITLADNEFVRFTVTFDKPVVAAAESVKDSHYADEYLQEIVADTALSFNFHEVDIATDEALLASASLRMSMSRDHALSKSPIVTINGTAVTVPMDWPGYDQANREQFFGAISIPFDIQLLTTTTNVVEVTFPDDGGRVSSMVIDINKIDRLEAAAQ